MIKRSNTLCIKYIVATTVIYASHYLLQPHDLKNMENEARPATPASIYISEEQASSSAERASNGEDYKRGATGNQIDSLNITTYNT